MKSVATIVVGLVVVLCAAAQPPLQAQLQSPTDLPAAKQRVRVAFAHALPKLDGARLQATVVQVNYGPGESSHPHSHPCAVIGYVLEGTIRTQVKGEPETLVRVGESFYEPPNGVHLVSANASQTQPASFLAFFVCDHTTPLSTDVKATAEPGGK